jgi:hypothetical protein
MNFEGRQESIYTPVDHLVLVQHIESAFVAGANAVSARRILVHVTKLHALLELVKGLGLVVVDLYAVVDDAIYYPAPRVGVGLKI